MKRLTLPPGTAFAIISSNADAVKYVRRQYKNWFGAIQTLGPLGKMFATQPATIARQDVELSPRAKAVLEGVRIARNDLREAGGAFDLKQVRTLMNEISRQAIDKHVQDGSLLAIPGPSNRRQFPALQFNNDGTVVEGLREVREALATRNPWTMLNFLAHPDDRLGGSPPIEVLKDGNIEMVVEAARRVGEQGA